MDHIISRDYIANRRAFIYCSLAYFHLLSVGQYSVKRLAGCVIRSFESSSIKCECLFCSSCCLYHTSDNIRIAISRL